MSGIGLARQAPARQSATAANSRNILRLAARNSYGEELGDGSSHLCEINDYKVLPLTQKEVIMMGDGLGSVVNARAKTQTVKYKFGHCTAENECIQDQL